MEDFIHKFNIVAYWQLFRIPLEIIIYSFFNKDKVITFLNEESSEHSKAYKEDLLLKKSLIKYKNEVIDYLKMFYKGEDKKVILENLTASHDYNFVCNVKIMNVEMIAKNSDNYTYQLFNNQIISLIIYKKLDEMKFTLDSVEIKKISKEWFEKDIHELFEFVMISHFINYLENYEILNKVFSYGLYKANHFGLIFPKQIVFITLYNRELILKELKNLYANIRKEIENILPISFYILRDGYSFNTYKQGYEGTMTQGDALSTMNKKEFHTFEEIENEFNKYAKICI
jgi:hypothetical protein